MKPKQLTIVLTLLACLAAVLFPPYHIPWTYRDNVYSFALAAPPDPPGRYSDPYEVNYEVLGFELVALLLLGSICHVVVGTRLFSGTLESIRARRARKRSK